MITHQMYNHDTVVGQLMVYNVIMVMGSIVIHTLTLQLSYSYFTFEIITLTISFSFEMDHYTNN